MGEPSAIGKEGLALFDVLITHGEIRSVARTLFGDGHYADAVKKAFIRIDNAVRDRAGMGEKTGDALMRTAFSVNNPVLRLNELLTESQKSEQQGYMDLYAGSMKGIRNPRAHEAEFKDDPETALELLTLANHLMRKLDAAVAVNA